eukprot:SAG11_NODE_4247_length_1987_cov_2.259004_1_plen_404_part_01
MELCDAKGAAVGAMLESCCVSAGDAAGGGQHRRTQGATARTGCDGFPPTCSAECSAQFVRIYEACQEAPLLTALPADARARWAEFRDKCTPLAQCDTFAEMQQNFNYLAVICCDEAGEECTDAGAGLRLPSTCAHAGCGAAVAQAQAVCGAFLASPLLATTSLGEALAGAAAICAAAPASSGSATRVYSMRDTVHLVGAAACGGAVITDGDGPYANGIREQLRVSAPPGFAACFSAQVRFFSLRACRRRLFVRSPLYCGPLSMQELDLAAGDELALLDTATEIARLSGATLPEAPLFCARGPELLLVLTTDGKGTAEGFRGRLVCTCADDEDWTSFEGQPCAVYSFQPQRAYCANDGADLPCPVSCGTPSCDADPDCDGGAARCERGACLCASDAAGACEDGAG